MTPETTSHGQGLGFVGGGPASFEVIREPRTTPFRYHRHRSVATHFAQRAACPADVAVPVRRVPHFPIQAVQTTRAGIAAQNISNDVARPRGPLARGRPPM